MQRAVSGSANAVSLHHQQDNALHSSKMKGACQHCWHWGRTQCHAARCMRGSQVQTLHVPCAHRVHESCWHIAAQNESHQSQKKASELPMHDVQGLPQRHPGVCDLVNRRLPPTVWPEENIVLKQLFNETYTCLGITMTIPSYHLERDLVKARRGCHHHRALNLSTIAAPIGWQYNKASTGEPFHCSSMAPVERLSHKSMEIATKPYAIDSIYSDFIKKRSTLVHYDKSSSAAFRGPTALSWAKVETLPKTHMNRWLKRPK